MRRERHSPVAPPAFALRLPGLAIRDCLLPGLAPSKAIERSVQWPHAGHCTRLVVLKRRALLVRSEAHMTAAQARDLLPRESLLLVYLSRYRVSEQCGAGSRSAAQEQLPNQSFLHAQ